MASPLTRQCVNMITGVSLELEITPPNSTQAAAKLAVLLHPWSRLGGCMDDPVLYAVKETLLSKDYHVLRFNSRGVGRSSGWASFTGTSEASDLQALVDWAVNRLSTVESVLIVGYSYGSLVASTMHRLPAPIEISHILISYPLSVRPWLTLFNSGTYTSKLSTLVNNPESRVLILYGTQDEFTGASAYETWVEGLQGATIAKIEGATHFWRGKAGKELQKIIVEWVKY